MEESKKVLVIETWERQPDGRIKHKVDFQDVNWNEVNKRVFGAGQRAMEEEAQWLKLLR